MTTATLKKSTIPSIQFASRMRLTDEQRDALRDAFNTKLSEANPDTVGRGGSIRVATATASTVESELKMDRITFSSLIASRESHAMPIILRLQRVLGVELISEKELKDAFTSYATYLKREYW